MNIDKQIKKFDKYYMFVSYKNKFKFVGNSNSKVEIFKNFKKKYLEKINKKYYLETNLILLKLTKVEFDPNKKIKLIAGPVKIDIVFFDLSKRGAVKENPKEKRNNHLFYTPKFLEKNKISKKHFKLIVEKAFNNKLEKKLLAPKTIEQIFKN